MVGQDTSCEPVDSQVLRPADLIESNTLGRIQHGMGRFIFKNGWAFRQFSSSDYFKAMHLVMGGTLSAGDDAVYVPLRVFDDAILVLPSGRSLIAQLLTMANHLVIEDADLLPCQLEHHFKQFALDDLSVRDLTDQAKRRGAAVYLVERGPIHENQACCRTAGEWPVKSTDAVASMSSSRPNRMLRGRLSATTSDNRRDAADFSDCLRTAKTTREAEFCSAAPTQENDRLFRQLQRVFSRGGDEVRSGFLGNNCSIP